MNLPWVSRALYESCRAKIAQYDKQQRLLCAEIEELKASIQRAEGAAAKAEELCEQMLNKEASVRYQLDLKNALNLRADNAQRIVSKAEHFMQEVYHLMAHVPRENRTELEEKMRKLRGY